MFLLKKMQADKSRYMTVYIEGGLGNQLFQVFSMWGIAKKHGYEPIIDSSDINNYPGNTWRPTYWKSWLGHIPNCDSVANLMATNSHQSILSIDEYNTTYPDDIKQLRDRGDNIMLRGYLQSSKYFENIREWVMDMLLNKIPESVKARVDTLYDGIAKKYGEGQQFVMIHRRKTDYHTLSYHFVLDMSYYNKALEYFDADKTTFVVFSDDPEDTAGEFSHLPHVEYVKDEDYIELLLMSRMDGAIIANSSFSWWGAYLMDKDRTKTVVCPERWYNDPAPDHAHHKFESHWKIIAMMQ